MKLKDYFETGMNVSVSIGLDDLRRWHQEVLADTKRQLEQAITDANAETYPSAKKVAEILDVNESTLFRWRKKGYLVPIEIGGKRRYKMSDVNKILGRAKS